MFRYPFKHLFLVDEAGKDQIFRRLQDFRIYPVSEIFLALFQDKTKTVKILQIYKILAGEKEISK